jgi:allantoin racemase
MRILVINPNTTQAMTDDIGRMARKYARPDTEIVAISPAYGPRSIEGHFEDYLAAAATVEEVAKRRDDFDAFVIACYGDPGLYACREITDKPVIGIAEASIRLSAFIAHNYSIVTVLPRVRPLLADLVRSVGMESRCASIRCCNLTVLEIEEDPQRAVIELISESRKAVEQDHAESILLGCAGMGPLDEQIRAAVNVPVLDGTVCAVKIAEGLYDYKQFTSKLAAFAWPEPKELLACSTILQEAAKGKPLHHTAGDGHATERAEFAL